MLKAIESLPEDQKAAILAELSTTFVQREEFDKVAKAKEELLNETKQAKQARKEAEELAEKTKFETAAKNGDIESLRSSYESKLAALNDQINNFSTEKKMNNINAISNDFVNNSVVDDSFVRDAMKAEFNKRLDVREEGIVVLDPQGNLTALTVDDLKQEFLANSKYARHIIGTKANGGGATRNGASEKPLPKTNKDLKSIPISDTAGRIEAIRARLNKG